LESSESKARTEKVLQRNEEEGERKEEDRVAFRKRAREGERLGGFLERIEARRSVVARWWRIGAVVK
jgi:hypothetical protein